MTWTVACVAETTVVASFTPELMRLEVDGQALEIHFDHSLTDSEDAHRTLVAMLRSLPGNA